MQVQVQITICWKLNFCVILNLECRKQFEQCLVILLSGVSGLYSGRKAHREIPAIIGSRLAGFPQVTVNVNSQHLSIARACQITCSHDDRAKSLFTDIRDFTTSCRGADTCAWHKFPDACHARNFTVADCCVAPFACPPCNYV